jgi:hypothetical protein
VHLYVCPSFHSCSPAWSVAPRQRRLESVRLDSDLFANFYARTVQLHCLVVKSFLQIVPFVPINILLEFYKPTSHAVSLRFLGSSSIQYSVIICLLFRVWIRNITSVYENFLFVTLFNYLHSIPILFFKQCNYKRVLSCGIQTRVVRWNSTDVSEEYEYIASNLDELTKFNQHRVQLDSNR